MNSKHLSAIAVIAALAIAAFATTAITQTASAALTCETKSGNAPGGQQDKPLKDGCEGSKLVVTPSGNAPSGQNP
jgi:hypothetical protein